MGLRTYTRTGDGWCAARVADAAEGLGAVVSTSLEPDREAHIITTTTERSLADLDLVLAVCRTIRAHCAEHAAEWCSIPPPDGPLMLLGSPQPVGHTGETVAFEYLPVGRLRATLWRGGGPLEMTFKLDAGDTPAIDRVVDLVLATSDELRSR